MGTTTNGQLHPMYIAHFGLSAAPFSITPDPHYLYLSARHREALAHLLYGVNEGPGFVLLTGEVGTGKTTLCRCLIEQLPNNVDVALLLNPRLSSNELLKALFDELRIEYDSQQFTLKDYIDRLYSYLLTAHGVGRRTVLILDEAQNLSAEVLEQVRLLTNLETASQKLLQIILVGQPELKQLLKRNNLRQLSQRITARYHLLPLSAKDTEAYINHRLAVSGAHSPLFTAAAIRLIYRYSSGVPRLINIICDRALLGGYVRSEPQIDTSIIRKAVQEVRGETISPSFSPNWLIVIAAILLLLGIAFWWWTSAAALNSQGSAAKTTSSANLTPPTKTLTYSSRSNPPETPTPATIEPTTPKPNLLHLLQTATVPNNTQAAFHTLFQYWNLDYTNLKGDKACQRAASQKFACLLRTGTWEDISRYNRPAIIELETDNGNQPHVHHVVVNRLQAEQVTLDFSGKKFDFSRQEINKYWLGQFLLLWKPPTMSSPVVKVGMTHDAVIWVRKHLDLIEGLRSEPHTLSPRFDYALKRRLVTFQRAQKLTADGVVGEQTLLALQALVGDGPTLK
jgi:general secretion pathway protein A